MGRIHSHRHGKAHSIRPITLVTSTGATKAEIEELIVKYAKDGMTPSQIGIKLRDQHAVPLVKPIIGRSVTAVLDEHDLLTEIPEDLNNIVNTAVGLQKHLKMHNGDRRNVRSLELIEAKVHRLSTYYKRIGRIPKKWKYKSVIAQLE